MVGSISLLVNRSTLEKLLVGSAPSPFTLRKATYTLPGTSVSSFSAWMMNTSSSSSSSDGVATTDTFSSTVDGSVFLTSYCSTMCSLKMCFTTVTTYSVSASVSSRTADDLSRAPNSFISGICSSSWAYFCAAAVAEAAASAPVSAALVGPTFGGLRDAVVAVSFLVRSSASACSLVTTGMVEMSKDCLNVDLSSDVT